MEQQPIIEDDEFRDELETEPFRHVSMKDIDLDSRPREKLSERGADTLSLEELFAILIGSGTKKKNATELMKEILLDCKYNLTLSCDLVQFAKSANFFSFFPFCPIFYYSEFLLCHHLSPRLALFYLYCFIYSMILYCSISYISLLPSRIESGSSALATSSVSSISSSVRRKCA